MSIITTYKCDHCGKQKQNSDDFITTIHISTSRDEGDLFIDGFDVCSFCYDILQEYVKSFIVEVN